MKNFERVNVIGQPVDCVTETQILKYVDDQIANDQQATIFAVNPEKAMRLEQDPEFAHLFRQTSVLIPDGIGMVLAARLLLKKSMARIAGADLMVTLCEHAAENNYKVFLLGAKESVNKQAAETLEHKYPKLNIVGRHDGYFDKEDSSDVIKGINNSGANLLFVALGSPLQEQWVYRNQAQLKVNVIQGVGGTFDVISGEVKRAPEFFIRLNLEWFYRLMSQPSRLIRQTALPKFALRVFLSMLTGRTSPQS